MPNPFNPVKSLIKPKPGLPSQGPLTSATAGPLSEQEAAAFREVRRAIDGNFANMFTSARFKSAEDAGDKASEVINGASDIADSILGDIANVQGYDTFKTGFNYIASPLNAVMDVAKNLTGIQDPADLLQAIGLQTLSGFYAAAAPYFGCIKGGIDAVNTLSSAVSDVRTGFRAYEATEIVNAGAPQQALHSVALLLNRRADDNFTKGLVQGTQAAVGAALTGTGVGGVASAAVSLASKIAVLAVVVRRRGIEWQEMKKGSQALLTPQKLSPAVFGACPLLGCYLLTSSDTSAIVLSCMASERPPPRDWMQQVNINMQFLDPIIEKAKSFITDSIWMLEGPNLQNKGRLVDARPWVERFWIEHFGAMNKGYRVINKANAVAAKVGGVYDKVSAPINAMVKADLQKLVTWAAPKG